MVQPQQASGNYLAGCRAKPGGLHLGHYYGCFFDVPIGLQGRFFFVIGDSLGDSESQTRDSVHTLACDVLAVAAWAKRSIIIVRESNLRSRLWPIFDEVSRITSFRLLAEVHPPSHQIKQRAFAGSVADYLFPLHQASYTFGLDITTACFNDDNSRFIDFTRKVARGVNERFGRCLRDDTVLINRVPGRLLGWDGRRMAKSNGNVLPLSASNDEVRLFFRKLVGHADQGVLDFKSRPAGELEKLYFRLFGESSVDESVHGKARIDHLAERAIAFLEEIGRHEIHRRTDVKGVLEADEISAMDMIDQVKARNDY